MAEYLTQDRPAWFNCPMSNTHTTHKCQAVNEAANGNTYSTRNLVLCGKNAKHTEMVKRSWNDEPTELHFCGLHSPAIKEAKRQAKLAIGRAENESRQNANQQMEIAAVKLAAQLGVETWHVKVEYSRELFVTTGRLALSSTALAAVQALLEGGAK